MDAEKKGLHVEYRLAGDDVSAFFLSLRKLGEDRLAEIEMVTREFLGQRDGMETVAGEELLRRVREGAVTVLDVRPSVEFRAGHIPGALSIPVAELKARFKELPKNRDVVAYCRGPYCLMSYEAVSLLRKKGHKARRFEAGLPEWRLAGLAVQRA